MIQQRCGGSFVCELTDVTDIKFNRILNEVSEATVTATFACTSCMSYVDPWRHEIAIYRNDEQVWVGPIIDIEFNTSDQTIVIYGKDLMTWADHRVVELADIEYAPEATDLSDAFDWLLNHAYCKDPWCMSWNLTPTGIPIQRFYPSFDKANGERWGGSYVAVGEELRTLAEAGVDWTVVNRNLWGGSTEVSNPLGTGVTLIDSHFRTPPPIKVTGVKMVNRAISAGGNGGYYGFYDSQIYIVPPVIGPIVPSLLDPLQQTYGLLETFATTDINDDVDTTPVGNQVPPNPITEDASSRYELLSTPYCFVSGGTLSPDAPVTFNMDLIPGGLIGIMLDSSVRPLVRSDTPAALRGKLRLKEVTVSVSGSDETVAITLTPAGTTTLTS